jgi:ABC-type phosphate transport system substrate-binding protein
MRKLLLLSDLKSLAPILALAILYGVLVGSASPEGTDLAIVVNKSTTLDTVSSADLRSMLLGEKTKWPDGKKVTPVETSPQSPERALLLKAVLKMSDAVLKRYYMQAAFTGKEILPPPELASAAALKQFVARTPGAIGCILASDVDNTVTALKVDGAAPGEAGYKLR